MKKTLYLIILIFLSCTPKPSIHHNNAKELKEDKEFFKAIEQYQKHIDTRLAVKNRPEWENPYLYYLDIGDVYLEMNDEKSATKYYEMAEDKKVKPAYVNDRYRYVATWYEEKGDLKSALKQLKKYKDRDPDLFNLMMDRIAKEIVKKESK